MKLIINRSQKMQVLPSAMIGNVVSIIVCFCAALILPIFVLNGTLEGVSIKVMANIIQGLGAFLGAVCAGYLVEDKKWVTLFLFTGTLAVFLIGCAVLLFSVDGKTIVNSLVSIVLGAICASFLITRINRSSKKKRIKRRSR